MPHACNICIPVDQGLTKIDNILEVLQSTLIFLYFLAIPYEWYCIKCAFLCLFFVCSACCSYVTRRQIKGPIWRALSQETISSLLITHSSYFFLSSPVQQRKETIIHRKTTLFEWGIWKSLNKFSLQCFCMAILPRRSIVYIHTTESCFGWPSVTKKNV